MFSVNRKSVYWEQMAISVRLVDLSLYGRYLETLQLDNKVHYQSIILLRGVDLFVDSFNQAISGPPKLRCS